jgi:hypothetical protein
MFGTLKYWGGWSKYEGRWWITVSMLGDGGKGRGKRLSEGEVVAVLLSGMS